MTTGWSPRRRLLIGVAGGVGVGVWIAVSAVMDGWSGVAGVVISLLAAALALVAVADPTRLTGRYFDLLVPLAIAVVTFLVSPRIVQSSEFYKAAAAVLPTLLLIFVVDKRSDFHAAATTREKRLAILVVIGYLTAGGYQTLYVLAFDDPARGDARLVCAAIVATLSVLLLSLLTPPASTPVDPGGESEPAASGQPGGSGA
jgi:hypothetical protein